MGGENNPAAKNPAEGRDAGKIVEESWHIIKAVNFPADECRLLHIKEHNSCLLVRPYMANLTNCLPCQPAFPV